MYYRLENNFETFRDRVRKCVRESLNKVYSSPMVDDPHYITFSPYVDELHNSIKREIYEPKVKKYISKCFLITKTIFIYTCYCLKLPNVNHRDIFSEICSY